MKRCTLAVMAVVVVAAVSVGLVGCKKATTTTPAATTTAAAPAVRITSPAAGATVPAGSVTVNIEASNFQIVPVGGTAAAGQGHVHYYLDVTIPTAAGQPAVSAAGTYKAVPATTATWDNLAPGSHTFGVQLVNNNHTPLSPPVTATVTVTVAAATTTATTTTTRPPTTTTTAATTTTTVATTTAAAPAVRITSPAAGVTVTAGSVTVNIEASNFQIVPAGGAAAAGQGHVHYYLDVTIPTAAGQPAVSAAGTYKAVPATSATWDNLAPGSHTFGVQLVNNNHTPLSPPVTAAVTVTVAAATTTTTTTTPTTTTTTTTTPGVPRRLPASHAGRDVCRVCHETPVPPAPKFPVPPRTPDHTAFTDALCKSCHLGP